MTPIERDIVCLRDACDEMARVIREMELPELAVRRMVSFAVAEFIYSDEPLKPMDF